MTTVVSICLASFWLPGLPTDRVQHRQLPDPPATQGEDGRPGLQSTADSGAQSHPKYVSLLPYLSLKKKVSLGL